MVDIFDEIEEDLRAERAQALLKKYGGVLIAGCLLVVGAVAGWKAWGWHQERQDSLAADQYLVAAAKADAPGLAGPNRPEAIGALEAVATSSSQGYRTLARLRTAVLKAGQGDMAGATLLWDQVAADTGADPLLRDLASLTWGFYNADRGDPALLEARLRPLAAPGNPWRALAQEQLAVLELRQGRTDTAKTALRKLAEDTTAPAGVRGRASELLGRVGG